MPGAVPSKDPPSRSSPTETACFCGGRPQPTHERLLREVGVDPVDVKTTAPAPSQWWRHAASGFGFAAPRRAGCPQIRRRRRRRGHGLRAGTGARDTRRGRHRARRPPRAGDGVAGRRRSRDATRARGRGSTPTARTRESGVWWIDAHELAMWRRQEPYAGLATCAAPCCTPTASFSRRRLRCGRANRGRGPGASPAFKPRTGAGTHPRGPPTQPRPSRRCKKRPRLPARRPLGGDGRRLLPGAKGARRRRRDTRCRHSAAGVASRAGAPVPMKRSPGVRAHPQKQARAYAGPVVDASGALLQEMMGRPLVGGD